MKVIPCRWTKHRKGAGTNGGESGARNLVAESIRSGAESTGGCVKLKTATEIRQSSARDAFVAESVYLVLNQSRTSGVFKVAQAEYLILLTSSLAAFILEVDGDSFLGWYLSPANLSHKRHFPWGSNVF